MFAKSLRRTLAVLGLAHQSAPAPASILAIADLNLDRPAEAFEALRRIACQARTEFDLAA